MTIGRTQLFKRVISDDTGLIKGRQNIAIVYCNCGESIPKESWNETNHYFDFKKSSLLDEDTRKWISDLVLKYWKVSNVKFIDRISERDEIYLNPQYLNYNLCVDWGFPLIAHSSSIVGWYNPATDDGYRYSNEASFIWVIFTWVKISEVKT